MICSTRKALSDGEGKKDPMPHTVLRALGRNGFTICQQGTPTLDMAVPAPPSSHRNPLILQRTLPDSTQKLHECADVIASQARVETAPIGHPINGADYLCPCLRP